MSLSARILIALFIIFISEAKFIPKKSDTCEAILGDDLIKEIAAYDSVRDEIFKYILEGDFKSKTYNE